MKDVVAIIPARSGSKSVKDKNIKYLGNHPLIAYSIEIARSSKYISRVIVSTDSESYAEIAKQYHAEVPFLRPKSISDDIAVDRDFLLHAMNWLNDNEGFCPEYWVHLRPTSPLRKSSILDDAIETILSENQSTSLRSAHKAPESPLKWFYKKDNLFKGILEGESANLPKEHFEQVYIPNGYVDILRSSFMMSSNSTHGDYMLAFETPVCTEVDSEHEFSFLEYQLNLNSNLELKNF